MRKTFQMMAVSIMAVSMVVMAGNMQVDFPVTAKAACTTNDIGNLQGLPWCELGSVQIAFPPVSTSSVMFYAIADNGVTNWQIGDTVVYTNAAATVSTQSYYPYKKIEILSAVGVTNCLFRSYPVSGTVRCIITKTGATSQAFKSVLFFKTQ